MQEDTFLQEYQKEWQQDNEAMSRLVDFPLETLHENIARYERRKRSRKIVWMTVSAAACLAFAVTTGIRYLTPNTPSGNPTLVAENIPRPYGHLSQEGTTYPTTSDVSPQDFFNPSQEGTENVGTAQQAKQTSPATYSSHDSGKSIEDLTPVIEEVVPADVQPSSEATAATIFPTTDANAIETNRLVAMGETKASVIEIETEGLVKITAPSRNTFHEAVVEPLLALVTFDM